MLKYIMFFLMCSVVHAADPVEWPFPGECHNHVIIRHDLQLEKLKPLELIADKYVAWLEWREKRDAIIKELRQPLIDMLVDEDRELKNDFNWVSRDNELTPVFLLRKRDEIEKDVDKILDCIITVKLGKCPPNPFKE